MLGFSLARPLLIKSALQSLKLLHFALRGFCLSLFPVQTRQPEMRLCRERSFFLDRKKPSPFFFGSGGVAFKEAAAFPNE